MSFCAQERHTTRLVNEEDDLVILLHLLHKLLEALLELTTVLGAGNLGRKGKATGHGGSARQDGQHSENRPGSRTRRAASYFCLLRQGRVWRSWQHMGDHLRGKQQLRAAGLALACLVLHSERRKKRLPSRERGPKSAPGDPCRG